MNRDTAEKVASIVQDAGGEIIGRTRLQKIVYLLSITGLEDGFSFGYKHFGPFSQDLAVAARYADLLGLLEETENQAAWGGSYSIYSTSDKSKQNVSEERLQLTKKAVKADAVELELVATALFLAKEDHDDPWAETARRKPEKTQDGRLNKAKALYQQLRIISPPIAWPDFD